MIIKDRNKARLLNTLRYICINKGMVIPEGDMISENGRIFEFEINIDSIEDLPQHIQRRLTNNLF